MIKYRKRNSTKLWIGRPNYANDYHPDWGDLILDEQENKLYRVVMVGGLADREGGAYGLRIIYPPNKNMQASLIDGSIYWQERKAAQ